MLPRLTTLCSLAVLAAAITPAHADWNAPQRFQSRDTGKTPVLVFYANETAPSEQLDQLLEWVRAAEDAESVLEKLEGDLEDFPATVDGHVSDIRELAPRMELDYVLFTNRMARDGRFEWYDAHSNCTVEDQLEVSDFDDPVYADSPLCHPSMFRQALSEVAERFSPATHEFVLITFSHGDSQHAMTSLYEGKLAAGSKQNVEALVASRPTSAPGLGTSKENNLGTGRDGNLNTGSLPSRGTRTYTPTVGVSKSEYFDILREFGEVQDLEFAAVIMSSCSSFVTDTTTVPANVSLLCTSDVDGLDYDAFDLSQVLTGDKSELAGNLEREIARRSAE